ncbi:MAG: sigma factor-like helix-turn-helix DNA-binding protein [Pseudomonadota bacterium]
MKEAIDQLPERARILIVLRDIEGMSTADAADAMGLSEGAIKTGLHRARQALKALLGSLFSEGAL